MFIALSWSLSKRQELTSIKKIYFTCFYNVKEGPTPRKSRSLRQKSRVLLLKGWFTPVQDRACYSLWRTIKSQKHSLLCWEQLTPLCDQQICVLCTFPTTPLFFPAVIQYKHKEWREKKKKKEKSSDGDIFPQFLFFLHILVYTTYPKITRQDINHNTIQGLWNSRTLIGSHIPFDFFLPSKISIYRIFSRNMKGWDFKMENKAENPFTRIPNSQSPFNIQIKDKTLQILCNSKTSSRKLRIQIIQGLES